MLYCRSVQFLLVYRRVLFLSFALVAAPSTAHCAGICQDAVSNTFDSLPIGEIAYRLNHLSEERYSPSEIRSMIEDDPVFLRSELTEFNERWKKARRPKIADSSQTVKQLVKIGFSHSVAERIVAHDPWLAIETLKRSKTKPVKVFKVYRGVSVAPKNWVPTEGVWAEKGDYEYSLGFASGSEGSGVHLDSELKDLRRQGYQYWGVLVEMEIPDFCYTEEKSTGVISVINQAVVARRIGSYFIGSRKDPKFTWFDFNEIKSELDIDPTYLLKEGLEMTRK